MRQFRKSGKERPVANPTVLAKQYEITVMPFVSICSNAENRFILDMYTQFSYEELDGVIFSSTTADNGSSTSHYPSRVGSLLILAYKFEQQISMTVDGFF